LNFDERISDFFLFFLIALMESLSRMSILQMADCAWVPAAVASASDLCVILGSDTDTDDGMLIGILWLAYAFCVELPRTRAEERRRAKKARWAAQAAWRRAIRVAALKNGTLIPTKPKTRPINVRQYDARSHAIAMAEWRTYGAQSE
jgi:hypothetical protein